MQCLRDRANFSGRRFHSHAREELFRDQQEYWQPESLWNSGSFPCLRYLAVTGLGNEWERRLLQRWFQGCEIEVVELDRLITSPLEGVRLVKLMGLQMFKKLKRVIVRSVHGTDTLASLQRMLSVCLKRPLIVQSTQLVLSGSLNLKRELDRLDAWRRYQGRRTGESVVHGLSGLLPLDDISLDPTAHPVSHLMQRHSPTRKHNRSHTLSRTVSDTLSHTLSGTRGRSQLERMLSDQGLDRVLKKDEEEDFFVASRSKQLQYHIGCLESLSPIQFDEETETAEREISEEAAKRGVKASNYLIAIGETRGTMEDLDKLLIFSRETESAVKLVPHTYIYLRLNGHTYCHTHGDTHLVTHT